MAGEITPYMAFGSYNESVNEYKEKYSVYKSQNRKTNENLESEFVFCEKGSRRVVANAYREKIEYAKSGIPRNASAIFFKNGLMYGTSSNDASKLDKFDFIQAKDKYAVDLNGNGTVESNEIFSGRLNRSAYEDAKNNGKLEKYKEYDENYRKTYTYVHGWTY